MAPVLDQTPRDTPDILPSGSSRSTSASTRPSSSLSSSRQISGSRMPVGAGKKPGSASDSVTKRLQSELMTLMMSKNTTISAFPTTSANLLHWTATLHGPADTPYAGLVFKLTFSFPNNYPFVPPEVLFTTPIYHPNIDFSGRICLDILKDKWSAVLNTTSVLLSLQSLLGEPNCSSPLNAEAAELWEKGASKDSVSEAEQARAEYQRRVKARHRDVNEL